MSDPRRVIIGITGASGTILGIRMLKLLQKVEGVETHLVMSPAAVRVMLIETEYTADDVNNLADVVHNCKDIGASIASGSFKCEGMIIAPCSVKTMGALAACMTDDLITRAADVSLKERRRVVLLLRETPLHAGHIRLMGEVTQAGAIVMPAVVGLYYKPDSVMDMIDHLAGRALDLLGIDAGTVKRWQGQSEKAAQGDDT